MSRLKAEGKHLGWPFGFSYSSLKGREIEIAKLIKERTTKTQIARPLGVGRATLHRFIKKHVTPLL